MTEVTLGIDIGGTNSVIGLVNKEGGILAQTKVSTGDFPEVPDYVDAVCAAIDGLMDQAGDVELKGIGIGAPNGNYYNGPIEYAPNLVWDGIVPLVELFGARYPVPVVVTNDANAAAMGEMIYGGAKGMKNFIVLTLGTGLGSGIVVNGDVVYGHTGFAGEIGHTIVEPFGRDCGCGREGCLENYVSATGIIRTIQEIFADRRDDSTLRQLPQSELTSKAIAEAALDGDDLAIEAFERTAETLALSIVNSVAFSSPQAIFLFGGLANAGDLIFEPTRKHVNDMIQNIFENTFEILPSGLKESDAAVLGASALAWNELDK